MGSEKGDFDRISDQLWRMFLLLITIFAFMFCAIGELKTEIKKIKTAVEKTSNAE